MLPTVTPPAAQAANEGAAASFALGSFADPGPDSPWSVDVDWGDGSAHTTWTVTAAGALATQSHLYADNGTYTVTVKVTDKDGGVGSGTFQVVVANVPPTVGTVTAPVAPMASNTAITATASFTDVGILDTHTALWEWGDGTNSSGTVTEANGSGSVSGVHAYTVAGVYTVKLTVTDKDGGSGQSTYQYVVVYDTSTSFVTGGGWINSPQGACKLPTCSNNTTGKANFGFVAKNLKTPTGQTEFRFPSGDLNFHSSSYTSVSITGAKAQVQGSGTINGAGDYGFLVSVIDGQASGGGCTDKFRIKIWNKATGAVLYDNQMGASNNADPTMAISGGSIIVHK